MKQAGKGVYMYIFGKVSSHCAVRHIQCAWVNNWTR